MKKIPLRTCIGCLAVRPKRELARLIVDDGKQLVTDQTGKASGRGAYLCRTDDEVAAIIGGKTKPTAAPTTIKRECLNQAVKKKALQHAFKQEVGVNPEKINISE